MVKQVYDYLSRQKVEKEKVFLKLYSTLQLKISKADSRFHGNDGQERYIDLARR